ncbi:MAG: SRPBCC family protein [Paracoccaceae bacterium]
MKLSCKQDLDVPAAFVLAQITDFDGWERAAMRRGVEIERSAGPAAPGLSWATSLRYRDRDRKVRIGLEQLSADGLVGFSIDSAPAGGTLDVEIVPMSSARSRLLIRIEIKPKTFAARLFVQSLRLARSRVERKLDQRAKALAKEIETRFRARTKLRAL